jgi:hypothetical protein
MAEMWQWLQPQEPVQFAVGLGLYIASNHVFELALTYYIVGGAAGALFERCLPLGCFARHAPAVYPLASTDRCGFPHSDVAHVDDLLALQACSGEAGGMVIHLSRVC